MGGFHLFQRTSKETSHNAEHIFDFQKDDDVPLHPLSFRDLHYNTTIDIDFSSFTIPTEEEIKDKGKSDWLAKSLVLLQTSWFVMQCIARAIEHLPITHLEVVTLAYAAMNFVIYIFWWNKPLNVNRPVRVFRKSEPSATQSEVISRETQHSRTWEFTWEEIRDVLERIAVYIGGLQDWSVDLRREDRVPRFWANSSSDDADIADFIVLGVGVCFGAIHCIAWGFSFPTHTELLMWRTSSVAITAIPIFITFGLFLAIRRLGGKFDLFIIIGVNFCTICGVILYILARAVTLALAFTSLRDLPPGTYKTVHWTTFIPHI